MIEIILGTLVLLIFILLFAFDKRKIKISHICTAAVLVALACAGRVAFSFIPSVQPASFFVIICGILLGARFGFASGVLLAVLSSFMTSVGPWTVWQALLWGLMGLFAAYVSRLGNIATAVYGFLSGFIFGVCMNLWWYSVANIPFTLSSFFAACSSSFTLDIAHGLSNFLLLCICPKSLVMKFYKHIN